MPVAQPQLLERQRINALIKVVQVAQAEAARIAQALAPWLFGLALARWGLGSLYLSAAVGVAMVGALMMLRARSTSDATQKTNY